MANRTVKDAKTIHKTNPQYLIEKIIRSRIYESRYWKEECFGLNEELVADKAAELRYIGGIYGGNIKPTPFLCLVLKMLQIQPQKDIVIEFIRQEKFKYARALGAYYLRLTGSSIEVWKYLEPLYNDYRKLRSIDRMGKFSVVHMDEFIDQLLREDRVFDVILPRISARKVHEDNGDLEQRISILEEELDNVDSDDDDTKADKNKGDEQKFERKEEEDDDETSEKDKVTEVVRSKEKKRDRDRDRERDVDRRERGRDRDRERDRHHDRDRDRDFDRKRRERSYSRERRRRSRSKSPERYRDKKSHPSKKNRDRDREKEKDQSSKSSKSKTLQDEIDEANALRAKLGLAPLRP